MARCKCRYILYVRKMTLTHSERLMIQNMTFNGARGFSQRPSDEFVAPYHVDSSRSTLAGAGVFGVTHSERNLTWVEVSLSGHMIPQYAPTAAYRMLEYLLGRVNDLTTNTPFTTQTQESNNGLQSE